MSKLASKQREYSQGILCGHKKSENLFGPKVAWTCTKGHAHVACGKLRMYFILFLSMSLLNFGFTCTQEKKGDGVAEDQR